MQMHADCRKSKVGFMAAVWFIVTVASSAVCAADDFMDVLFTKDSPLRYEGPECAVKESGWMPGERLPVVDEGKFVGKGIGGAGAKGFSVALFFRPLDKGSVYTGNNAGAMIISAGSGWYDGWRLYTTWGNNWPSLNIGRPGVGAWALHSSLQIVPYEWNVICVTCDSVSGKVRLYINGTLAAEGVYKGVITPYHLNAINVGNAGYGVGSLRMQVRRLVMDKVPWDAQKVRNVSFGDAKGVADFDGYLKIRRQNPDNLAQSIVTLLGRDCLNPIVRGEATAYLMRQFDRQPPPPASVLEGMLKNVEKMSARNRFRLEMSLARAYALEGDGRRSKSLFGRLVSACTNEVWQAEARWNFADTLLSSGNLSAARKQFESIRTLSGATPYFRSMAALSAARIHELAGEYGNASAEFRKAAAFCEAEGEFHLKWLSENGVERCSRLSDGKPTFDLSASHRPPAPLPKPGAEIHVSPEGNDGADGSLSRPFATLERARREVNSLRDGKGALPSGGVCVYLHGGVYPMAKTFRLTAADSGSADAPVVYRAWGGEKPVLSGGAVLTGAVRVSDPEVLKRLPASARGNVFAFDLGRQGITNLAPPVALGFTKPVREVINLYENGVQMTKARWPNEGYAYTGTVPKGSKTIFSFDRKHLSGWAGSPDVCMSGYWAVSWADNSVPVAEINPQKGTVKLAEAPWRGVKPDMPFYVFNVFAELDQPGEWVLDRPNRKLYFWPKGNGDSLEYTLSLMRAPFIHADGTRNFVLDGLAFECGQSDGVVFKNGKDIVVSGCRLRNLGGTAIEIKWCSDVNVFGNRISDIGFCAIVASGGSRKKLVPCGINIENNDVARHSRNTDTYNPAACIYGCGVRVAHNHFYDGPSSAIHIDGNDHVIEYNRVEKMVLRSDDQGGIDMFGDPSYRGVVMRYNIWKDFGSGVPSHWQCGIRLDDAISGVVVYGNRFERCSSGIFGGVQIHGGQHNIVDNNRFLDCRYGVSFSPWLRTRWENGLEGKYRKQIYENVDVRTEPYISRYPRLRGMRTDLNANVVSRNLVVGADRVLFSAPETGLYWDNRQASGIKQSPLLWEPLPPVRAVGRYSHPRSLP